MRWKSCSRSGPLSPARCVSYEVNWSATWAAKEVLSEEEDMSSVCLAELMVSSTIFCAASMPQQRSTSMKRHGSSHSPHLIRLYFPPQWQVQKTLMAVRSEAYDVEWKQST